MDFFDKSELEVLEAHRVKCSPDWSWNSLSNGWQGLHLWLIVDGRGEMETPDRSHALSSGDAFVLRMEEPNLAQHSPENPLEVYGIHFNLKDRHHLDIVLDYEDMPRHRKLEDPIFVFSCAERCTHAVKEGKMLEASHWCRSILIDLQRQDREQKAKHSVGSLAQGLESWHHRMLSLPEGDHDPEVEAKALGISRDHLDRSFRDLYGVPPRRFLIQVRLRKAVALLTSSSLSISRIAQQLGYSDALFFSRQFSKHMGCPPSSYRKRRLSG